MATQTPHPRTPVASAGPRAGTLLDDCGVWFGIATGLVVLTLFVAGLAGLGTATSAVAVIVVGGLAAARLPGLVALALGVVGWAFFTGFAENSLGQLTFAGGDVERLVGFAAATAAIAAVVRTGTAARRG
ncbi:MAG: hypothetical protein JWQ74_2982 [Marmoricola sp.]|nr:hypothetical protein [Marmoricola sp.]